jgi:hypothetical protein
MSEDMYIYQFINVTFVHYLVLLLSLVSFFSRKTYFFFGYRYDDDGRVPDDGSPNGKELRRKHTQQMMIATNRFDCTLYVVCVHVDWSCTKRQKVQLYSFQGSAVVVLVVVVLTTGTFRTVGVKPRPCNSCSHFRWTVISGAWIQP